jgi:hypothetical protein
MSKTISFVASDELAKYLEEESERRMTTISSTAQMLLAEKARETGGVPTESEQSDEEESGESGNEGEPTVFDECSEPWYEPNSNKHDFAVEVPENADVSDSGDVRYYITEGGAAKALRRWYE